jgi:F0F1-type ATP synthase epsilon subunit
LTVLAEMAVPVDDFDHAALADAIRSMEEDVAGEKDEWKRDKLAHKLAQHRALQSALVS